MGAMNKLTFTETFICARMFCRILPVSHLQSVEPSSSRFALSLVAIVHMIFALGCIASVSQFDLCLPRSEENCTRGKAIKFHQP